MRVTAAFFLIVLAGSILSAQIDGSIHILPSPDEITGWTRRGEIRTYPPENMWEPIDGEAEQYLQYGCESLTIAGYVRDADGFEISVEIYRMNSALMSFGIYSAQRLTDGPFLPVGVQGYRVAGGLFFFEGPYYIKLKAVRAGTGGAAGSDRSKGLEALDEGTVLRTFGEIIAAHCPEKTSFPAIFKYFPEEELVHDSFGYVTDGILGIKGLSGAFSTRYMIAGKEVELFLLRKDGAESAQRTISLLEQFLTKHGKSPIETFKTDSAEGFLAHSRYHGPILALRCSGDVVIITGTENADGAGKLALQLLKNLPDKG